MVKVSFKISKVEKEYLEDVAEMASNDLKTEVTPERWIFRVFRVIGGSYNGDWLWLQKHGWIEYSTKLNPDGSPVKDAPTIRYNLADISMYTSITEDAKSGYIVDITKGIMERLTHAASLSRQQLIARGVKPKWTTFQQYLQISLEEQLLIAKNMADLKADEKDEESLFKVRPK